jgi:hemoglobin/transferrin/lactoferrin receptor protein
VSSQATPNLKKMKLKNIFLLAVLLLAAANNGYAQNIVLRGKTNLQPIAQAAIQNEDKSKTVVSDAKGNANLSGFEAGAVLTIYHISFQKMTIRNSGIDDNQIISLEDKIFNLSETVFSANRQEESKLDIPHKIDVIDEKEIAFTNPQTSGDMLRNTGNVYVQTSQFGGSSPILRGFEANKVSIVVDGVRMNNAIYRGGHLQNVITIDPNMLDRAEVVFGNGSVMYGSDALGGVMHFYSRNPDLSSSQKPLIKGGAFYRYGSAMNENSANLNLNMGFKKVGFLTSFTQKNFDDVIAGTNRPDDYPNMFKREFFVTRKPDNTGDIANRAENVNRQYGSGYVQSDFMQKILLQATQNTRFIANVQYSTSSNIPRTDRLGEVVTNAVGVRLPNFATWEYGPQNRLFGSLRAEFNKRNAIFDNATFIASYQDIEESRITRNFNNSTRTNRTEKVKVYAFNADLRKNLARQHELRYGAEVYYNDVQSTVDRLNVVTNVPATPGTTRYPNQGSSMTGAAAYANYSWEIGRNRTNFVLSSGLRLNYVGLQSKDSRFADGTYPFKFDNTLTQSNTALNGYIGLVALPHRNIKISGMFSTGFRAPNVDDVGKVFESAANVSVTVPNPNLKPEYTTTGELSAAYQIENKILIEGTAFYTNFIDAMVVRPTVYNGQTTILFGGRDTPIQAMQNASNAYIYGFQGTIRARFSKFVSFKSNLTYTVGTVTKDPIFTKDVPLDHIPPLYGTTSLVFEIRRVKAEFWSMYNGWKYLADYSTSGEDNLQYATKDGMPSWVTFNLRTSAQINRFVQLQFALDNIFDTHYRYFASGISAAGRNATVAVRVSF